MKRIFLAIGLLCTLSNLNLDAKTYVASFESQQFANSFKNWLWSGKTFTILSTKIIDGKHLVTFVGDDTSSNPGNFACDYFECDIKEVQ